MISRFVALVLLIMLSPILLMTALIIFLEDGSPIYFRQQRVGRNKKLFWIYKFRTMKRDTPNVAKHLLEDPSTFHLKYGSLIRDFSIDELPNLINILKGEMNFIGPRPALYNEYELIDLREKAGINELKPGLTGLAQVNGRDFLANEGKCKYDQEYLEKRSFLFDLKIIYCSFIVVARPILLKLKR
jgi:O-antigen biosynthesis protein WbqP